MVDTESAAASAGPLAKVRSMLGWLVVNAVLSYLLLYPLGLGELAIRHLLARALDAPWSPFEGDPGALQASLIGFVLMGCPLLVVAILVNRARSTAQWSAGLPRVLFWAITAAVLVMPLVVSELIDVTIPQMLGKGVLW
ncbi:hypothetical protein ACQPXM_02295 [Kribbella sp. CA-253562]|uniref:hypothetical protein n=1 Tax=Kribbella sp. CA-253562 TaxID=3239942 RepID=UPI003D8CD604